MHCHFLVGGCGYAVSFLSWVWLCSVISQLVGVATSVMSQLVGVAMQCHVLSWWVWLCSVMFSVGGCG